MFVERRKNNTLRIPLNVMLKYMVESPGLEPGLSDYKSPVLTFKLALNWCRKWDSNPHIFRRSSTNSDKNIASNYTIQGYTV